MEGPDEDRSLTKKGWREADDRDSLADAGIERILQPLRVRAVGQALAKLIKAPVEISPLLAEEPDIDAAYALIDGLIGTNAVVCSHGDVAPALINRMMWGAPPSTSGSIAPRAPSGWSGWRRNSPTPTTGRHPKSDQRGRTQLDGWHIFRWMDVERAICSSG